jgi:transposase
LTDPRRDERRRILRQERKVTAADLAAVIKGLTLEHSSGAVEGNVTRIKRLKRDGYGRANFDLLRIQILLAA